MLRWPGLALHVYPLAKPLPFEVRHHTNCQNWGYDQHPARQDLKTRCERLEKVIQRRPSYFQTCGFDTRAGHAYMFNAMAPANCSCIIGKYRGDASCPDLCACTVGVDGDRRVGTAPDEVAAAMVELESRCAALVSVHQRWCAGLGANQPPRNALLRFVRVLATVIENFLTIHPYMDGNGHSARLLVYLMMSRAGYTPVHWAIDEKQPYSDALTAHRDGKPGALQAFLVNAIG